MGCHADSRSVTFGHVRCANTRLIVRKCISQRIVMESRSDWCVTDAIRESCQRDEADGKLDVLEYHTRRYCDTDDVGAFGKEQPSDD